MTRPDFTRLIPIGRAHVVFKPHQNSDQTLVAELFGARYDVWMFTTRWTRIVRSGSEPRDPSRDDCISLIHQLHETQQNHSVRIRQIGRRCIGTIPVQTDLGPGIAVGEISSTGPELLRLLQQTADRAVGLEQQARRSSRQSYIGDDSEDWRAHFRELHWLTQLPAGVVPQSTEPPEGLVADAILPQLRELLDAHSLVFIRNDRRAMFGQDVGEDHWMAGDRLNHGTIRAVLEAYSADAASSNGIYRNNVVGREIDGSDDNDHCTSLILCPVRWPGASTGWLIATRTAIDHKTQFDPVELELMRAAASALATHGRIRGLLDNQEQLLFGVVRALVNALDAKDSYTCGHSDRVAEFARLIAETMGLSAMECERIHMTGLLHDIGKVGIPDRVLSKPGPLTEAEMDLIRQHPVTGYEILSHLSSFDYVLPGVLHHHESLDGSGYPHGLCGDDIPQMARILAVADAWDAMTSSRPYRAGMPSDKAASILRDGSGSQWDPECVDAFFRCMDGIQLNTDRPHTSLAAPKMVRRDAVSTFMRWDGE